MTGGSVVYHAGDGRVSPDDDRPTKPGSRHEALRQPGSSGGDFDVQAGDGLANNTSQPRARRPACHAAGKSGERYWRKVLRE